MNDPAVIAEMLHKAKTIAVVGISDKSWRASHNIGRYLHDHGYRVIPVNPALSEVLGLNCYPNLESAQTAAKVNSARASTLSMYSAPPNMCRQSWKT